MRRDCESRRAGDHVLLVRTNEFSTEVYIIRPEGTRQSLVADSVPLIKQDQ